MISAVASGFLVFAFLEPLFAPVGFEISFVFLYLLALDGACVGLALGVLLPSVLPGASFGVLTGLLVCLLAGQWNLYIFPVASGLIAVLCVASSLV